jgi:hypothetical protein
VAASRALASQGLVSDLRHCAENRAGTKAGGGPSEALALFDAAVLLFLVGLGLSSVLVGLMKRSSRASPPEGASAAFGDDGDIEGQALEPHPCGRAAAISLWSFAEVSLVREVADVGEDVRRGGGQDGHAQVLFGVDRQDAAVADGPCRDSVAVQGPTGRRTVE